MTAPVTALPLTAPSVDMSDPLFAIEHLARLFKLEVDSARELTYRADLPQPIKIGRPSTSGTIASGHVPRAGVR